MGFFPVDEKTIAYFKGTGRTADEIAAFEAYFKAQGLFGVPKSGSIDYSSVVSLDLSSVAPSLAGPKRPQDRIEIGHVARRFAKLFSAPVTVPCRPRYLALRWSSAGTSVQPAMATSASARSE